MQFQLKSISKSAIPEALDRAHRYRLLNESSQAESICLDVLAIDPANQTALVTLLLAITDQFGDDVPVARAREVLNSIKGEYERAYYAGIIAERSARAHWKQRLPASCFVAYDEFQDALHWYEKAETLRPAGNDEAILRWNTCARTLMRTPELRPAPQESLEPVLDD
jgi:tetratricopeptide (TPR) repeat protein